MWMEPQFWNELRIIQSAFVKLPFTANLHLALLLDIHAKNSTYSRNVFCLNTDTVFLNLLSCKTVEDYYKFPFEKSHYCHYCKKPGTLLEKPSARVFVETKVSYAFTAQNWPDIQYVTAIIYSETPIKEKQLKRRDKSMKSPKLQYAAV